MIENIYQQIADRTNGDIYLGVVGPVRTGKSTFVKRFMETLVIPNIQNIYQKERAKDELPQSSSGKTIMTSEPKFVPEEAVEICPDGTSKLSIRLIDSVGYMIPGALGAEENGVPRMITTPWSADEIPMSEAAELGTKRIMDDHCTIGIVITTDGTIHDISREDYLQAEDKAVTDMMSTGKPFCVIVNSAQPKEKLAQDIKSKIEETYGVSCIAANCLTLDEATIKDILTEILYGFPLSEVQLYLPQWILALSGDHPVNRELYHVLQNNAENISTIRDLPNLLDKITEIPGFKGYHIKNIEAGKGNIEAEILTNESLFYETISGYSGLDIKNDRDLIQLLKELSAIKKSYDKVDTALEQVRATGYGIVMPSPDEMQLDAPEIVRKGSNYGVRLKASAPSIHMIRADIQTEINPIVGDEKQSEELLQYLLEEYEGDTQKLWRSNIFGKSVYELVSEGLGNKLTRIPEDARYKLRSTLSQIINEGSSGLLCIILG